MLSFPGESDVVVRTRQIMIDLIDKVEDGNSWVHCSNCFKDHQRSVRGFAVVRSRTHITLLVDQTRVALHNNGGERKFTVGNNSMMHIPRIQ